LFQVWSMVGWFHCCGPNGTLKHHDRSLWQWTTHFMCWEAQGKTGRHAPTNLLPPTRPASPPNPPFSCEHINGLIHWWSQHPHDPISIVPPTGDQPFNTTLLRGQFFIQT
jgi:hypothetical protein